VQGEEIVVDEEFRKQVEALAARGLNKLEIASSLKINIRTFHRKIEEHPELEDDIESGRGQGCAVIKNKLYEKAKDGDNHCLTLFLKNFSDIRDKTELDIPKGFTITIGNKDADNA